MKLELCVGLHIVDLDYPGGILVVKASVGDGFTKDQGSLLMSFMPTR